MGTAITKPGQQQTDQEARVPRSRSHFQPFYQNYGTHRFGEYTPHFVAEGLPDDQGFKFRSAHQIRTYSLKSPLLSDLVCHKDYFMVPYQAILPLNWEKYVKNPKLGDDLPSDAGTYVSSVLGKISHGIDVLRNAVIEQIINTPQEFFIHFLRLLAFSQWMVSNGSLLASLGAHLGNYVRWTNPFNNGKTTDELVDGFFTHLINLAANSDEYFTVTVSASEVYRVYFSLVLPEDLDLTISSARPITLRDFWYMFLDQPTITAAMIGTSDVLESFQDDFEGEAPQMEVPLYNILYNLQQEYPLGLDFRRVWAYNLAVMHYYTNDNIDYIYSAELYRQLIGAYAYAANSNAFATFTYNGVVTQYDFLSAKYLSLFISNADLPALSCIFNFHRSLKYIDYFTGCRARPLAVGNTDVAVNNNAVSVVDITQNIQKQRFLNAVNRAASTVEGYIKDIFGVKPAYDFHNPAFLASTKDQVRGVENENTGSDQFSRANSITSVLRGNAEKYMFETQFDRPVVVVGITYYDIPRVYSDSIDRPMMYKDRFDEFIPEMQFVGDEKLLQAELRPLLGADPGEAFGYQGRYNELKMRFNVCYGGFSSYALRSWAFTNPLTSELDKHVSPNFIRSRQSDLDRYYLQLSGFSYCTYFHFIVVNTNYLEVNRPLVKKPQIL